MPQHHILNF
jgi:hypothetical protein